MEDRFIIDKNGEIIGTIDLVEFNARLESLYPTFMGEREHEFIAISINENDGNDMIRRARRKSTSWRSGASDDDRQPKLERFDVSYRNESGEKIWPAPVVTVLLIGWEGEIAQRLSIGYVTLKEWIRQPRSFKVIPLG